LLLSTLTSPSPFSRALTPPPSIFYPPFPPTPLSNREERSLQQLRVAKPNRSKVHACMHAPSRTDPTSHSQPLQPSLFLSVRERLPNTPKKRETLSPLRQETSIQALRFTNRCTQPLLKIVTWFSKVCLCPKRARRDKRRPLNHIRNSKR